MPIYNLQLLKRVEVADQTYVFHFKKPANLVYRPGQYGGFTLINPPFENRSNSTRRFSLLNSPHSDTLAFATRIQNSYYKQALMSLNPQDEIKFAGPTGQFTLDQTNETPVVLIAGGIGISPFYSMIEEATQTKSPRSITLLYGNRSLRETAFLPELKQFAQHNPHFKLMATLEHADEAWQGERGFISPIMLKRAMPDLMLPHYYICGSPHMVTALQALLIESGIEETKIKVEDFPGY